ncbi:excitatory amino acid transporter 1-like [Brevipalpus obovatus]|uniref:excitatory amino acid transporter 1-like n=1 Tax=Brevipalpus obovatus TaxID=246614 RepID=UPI003D9E8C92
MAKFIKILKNNSMPILTVISVVLAILAGIILRTTESKWSKRDLTYLEFPGEMFLRALKCLVIPIMITSLISSLASMEAHVFKRVGRMACIYYFFTTLISIIFGIIIVSIIKPGERTSVDDRSSGSSSKAHTRNTTTTDTFLDLIRNLIPSNVFEACIRTSVTEIRKTKNDNGTIEDEVVITTIDSTNIMGIVFMSIIVGLFIASLGDEVNSIKHFFIELNKIIMKITIGVIQFTPIGVFFLILPRILSVSNVDQLLGSVAWYTFTILFALIIHGSIVLPAIYLICTRRNPYKVISGLSSALLAAFGTGSSTATLPITMSCLENNLGLDSRVTRALIPIGAVVNMDGTALYEAVAAIYIAQYRHIPMSFSKLVITSITATAASIGAAGIPQAGLVTMVIVLNALGLPTSDISLIFMVDWFLDRFRTVVNVLGDSFGAALVNILCKDSLNEMNEMDPKPSSVITRSISHHREEIPVIGNNNVNGKEVFTENHSSSELFSTQTNRKNQPE